MLERRRGAGRNQAGTGRRVYGGDRRRPGRFALTQQLRYLVKRRFCRRGSPMQDA